MIQGILDRIQLFFAFIIATILSSIFILLLLILVLAIGIALAIASLIFGTDILKD